MTGAAQPLDGANLAARPDPWYLGLDIGTTGISAVLLNYRTGELHPLYWGEGEMPEPSQRRFRLPAAVLAPVMEQVFHPDIELSDEAIADPAALGQVLLNQIKPYLKVAIPYFSITSQTWEPGVQWSDQHSVSLQVIVQGLRVLLGTLNPQQPNSSTAPLTCSALGLEPDAMQQAIGRLSGVIVGCPTAWPEPYRFNVREALLAAGLVTSPSQVVFLEEAIAALISSLRSAEGRAVVLPEALHANAHLHNLSWQGPTVVISAGASLTELALANLPNPISTLTTDLVKLRQFAYAGDALDQDIAIRLLYPTWLYQTNQTGLSYWQALGFDQLELPNPGETERLKRDRLMQRWAGLPEGQSLLETARMLKLALQHRDHLSVEIAGQSIAVTRQDMGSQIFLPYIQRLNRELNALLNQSRISPADVSQVVCTGGTASIGAIARWLREKLPNATIIQDTYLAATTPQETSLRSCSRIAYGLATVPLHPQLINQPQQHFSDLYLAVELIRTLAIQPATFDDVLQQLEHRGIDTQLCQERIRALLDGQQESGLFPTELDRSLLTLSSLNQSDYATLMARPLFYKSNAETYALTQRELICTYVDDLIAGTQQKLLQPNTAFLIPVL